MLCTSLFYKQFSNKRSTMKTKYTYKDKKAGKKTDRVTETQTKI